MTKFGRGSLPRIFFLFLGIFALSVFLLSYIFPFHLVPWASFYNEFLFGCSIALGTSLLIVRGSVCFDRPWIFVALLTAILLHASLVDSVSQVQITLGLIFFLFAVLGWLAYNLGLNIRGTWWFNATLLVLWLAAIASAVVAIFQWSGVVSSADWDPSFILYSEGGGRVSSNIGQANNLGTLLVIGMGVVGYFWYQPVQRTMLWRIGAVLSMLLLVFGVYFSGSRTATLNLLLWPVLFAGWMLWRKQQWCWLALLPIGLLVAVQWLMPPLIEWWGLFPAQEARSLASDAARPRLWMMVLTAIAEQPWWGHGFGAVANAHLRLSPEFGSIGGTIAQHAHNTVLDMWVTFGVPLGSLIVGGVLWMWVRAWLRCQTASDQFVWLMATAMLVHAQLEYPLHYGFFFWLLCLLLGALGGKEWKVVQIRHAATVSLAWLVVFMAVALSVWHAYVQTESLYTAYRQRGPEATRQLLNSLPPDTLGRTLYPELYERLRWVTTPMDEVLALPDAELKALEQQASRYPLPTLGWRMAFAQAARGNSEQAEWWALRMCIMFDPQVCRSASEEWLRRAEGNPAWPVLPWDQWLHQ